MQIRLKSLAILFRRVNLWRTVYFNFHYLPLKAALRLPIMVFWRTEFHRLKGRVVIDAPIKTGMVKLGSHGVGTIDMLYSRTMWDLSGTLVIKGDASIGRGTKISVGEGATLTLGEGFMVTGNSEIVCHKEISFGPDCLLSWDVLVMDTDFHHILDEKGEIVNSPKPIHIGKHVWIGCRNVILKGVSIADGCVIAANSTITNNIEEPRCIIGGQGKDAAILRRDVDWKES